MLCNRGDSWVQGIVVYHWYREIDWEPWRESSPYQVLMTTECDCMHYCKCIRLIHAPEDNDDFIKKVQKKILPNPLPRSLSTNIFAYETLKKKLQPSLTQKEYKWIDSHLLDLYQSMRRTLSRKRITYDHGINILLYF